MKLMSKKYMIELIKFYADGDHNPNRMYDILFYIYQKKYEKAMEIVNIINRFIGHDEFEVIKNEKRN